MNIRQVFNYADGGDIFSLRHSQGIEKMAFSESALIPSGGATLTSHIRQLFNKPDSYNGRIGAHPDFLNLRDGEEKKQYVVSVFADIQGSTNLVFKYDLPTVRVIKNRILSVAIEFFQGCDGHVHRLQGDAIFAYFGDSENSISDSVINALNACTLLQAYINEHLRSQFEDNGIDPIKLRVGIDLGYDVDVLWTKYGIRDCYEITTTSLHTDLASKLQNKCSVNKIMIGEKVREHLDLPDEFVSIKTKIKNGAKTEQRYIVDRHDFRYKMYQFEWEKYIVGFSFYKPEGIFQDLSLVCKYGDSTDILVEYISNSKSIEKEKLLRFSISGLRDFENYDIEWRVFNRGVEATTSGEQEFEMTNSRGHLYCPQSTCYKGHHYMRCTLYRNNIIVGQEYFGVFVNQE